jgi:hypothetical protein
MFWAILKEAMKAHEPLEPTAYAPAQLRVWVNHIKITFILVGALFLSACTGYRYSMIEDNSAYFLKGEFYNNKTVTLGTLFLTVHNS